jgi:phenylpyruvate tautomerase PptA (4-oxalocrotonate tautomerase family)
MIVGVVFKADFMPQVKIYGLQSQLNPMKAKLSDVIHSCMMDAFQYPAEKRFHRFFPMLPEDFTYAPDRSPRYTIVELSMFEGRSVEAKKQFIRLMFDRFKGLDIEPNDLEIVIYETPKHNWGFRGLPGDEHALNYNINV